jgi:ribonuclease J
VELRILDGANSIGGTKILLDTGSKRLLLDFGLNYKRYGLYFEEYLKPRSSRGLADLWRLGLIPHHPDLYRDDLWPHDLKREGEPLAVDLILLSHAHMDHCGLLGVVRPEIPVAATPPTWGILKAIQDAGKAEFHAETVYAVPREPVPGDPRALKAAAWKAAAARGREIRLVGEAPAELMEFLRRPPNPRGRGLEPGNIRSLAEESPGGDIRAFGVDHSIPGAVGYAVETDAGWVVYTGDLSLHGRGRERTLRFVEEAKRLRPAVLLIEGTRAGPLGGENLTEEEVAARAHGIVADSRGELVIADFSPRQVERLQSFLGIAEATGRILVVLAKDM